VTTYDNVPHEHWMNELNNVDRWNIKHILSAFSLFDLPESMLDVGCGNGTMVRIARKLGVDAYGIDQLVEPSWEPYFFHKNLVDLFILHLKVDIVISLEVAEHLHPSAHTTYCETLCNNLKEGVNKFLIFSAARPGQGGTGHISCEPASYWSHEFYLRGLTANDLMTSRLALLWSKIDSPLGHLSDNLMVFHKGGTS